MFKKFFKRLGWTAQRRRWAGVDVVVVRLGVIRMVFLTPLIGRWVWEHPKHGVWGVALGTDRDWRGDVDILTVHYGWREWRRFKFSER